MVALPPERSSPGAPLVSLPAGQNSIRRLPVPLTPLVGREREIRALSHLLNDPAIRLVTLTGPAGVGKTRLALRAAEKVADAFADGCWFVPLATVRNATLVGTEIAQALGVRETGHRSLREGIVTFLREKESLLLLDNVEHLLDAVPLLTELLLSCPGLTCVATSRVLLRISGEHAFPVPPLPLPPASHAPTAQRAIGSPAVQLFVNRAQAVRPDFTLTDDNAAAVEAVCRRLDGLPLAVELAAARIRHLTPVELADRLLDRPAGEALRMLTGGPRDAPARQQTLRYAIAWSYDLLQPAEQALFRRLAIFVDGFTLAATMAVARPGVLEWGVAEEVAALVDQSLVQRADEAGSESRYVMLETIREFALEQLANVGEDSGVAAAHAVYFLELAEATALAPFQPDSGPLLSRLQGERANLRAALAWFEQAGQPEQQLRLAVALYFPWVLSGFLAELQDWLERGLAAAIDPPLSLRALASWALGGVLRLQGELNRAESLLEDAVARLRELGDRRRTALALQGLGHVMLRRGDLERARLMQEEALAILEKFANEPWARSAAATTLAHLGNIAMAAGDIARAEARFAESLERQQALAQDPGASHAYASYPLTGLGDVARSRGRHAEALSHYQHALSQARRFREVRSIANALAGVAGALAAGGEWEQAARLFGAAERLHEEAGLHFDLEAMNRQRALGLPEPWCRADDPVGPNEPLRQALASSQTKALPDPAAARAAWATGHAVPLDAAVQEALAATLPVASQLPGDTTLTPRELEVLRLLAAGKADREIAETLYISQRTASKHVSNILAKLEVASRSEAAVIAIRHGLI